MWTGVGGKSVRLPQTSVTTDSEPWGEEQREQAANVTVTKRRELRHGSSAGTEMVGHLPGHGGGLPLLGMTDYREDMQVYLRVFLSKHWTWADNRTVKPVWARGDEGIA
ncbi:hypothetical protein EYF80_001148 [Liparis tanakae]|uniref:Uncharacterized protein n=1 Tax=Liparis tanakae TaxID=230148 RepID=A0A4Z2JDP7_9TELE|nr:hypothetical protein EYF80_001148 [Liparis tanakae]